MLDGLDEIDWGSLSHAYGGADDVPDFLRALISPDAPPDDIDLRFGNIYHQGTVYSATAAAVPFLYELLALPQVRGRSNLAYLLACIAAGRGYLEVHAVGPWGELTWRKILGDKGKSLEEEMAKEAAITESVHRAASARLVDLVPFLHDDEPEIRRAVAEALGKYPEHATTALPALETAATSETDEEAREALRESLEHLASP